MTPECHATRCEQDDPGVSDQLVYFMTHPATNHHQVILEFPLEEQRLLKMRFQQEFLCAGSGSQCSHMSVIFSTWWLIEPGLPVQALVRAPLICQELQLAWVLWQMVLLPLPTEPVAEGAKESKRRPPCRLLATALWRCSGAMSDV